MGNRISILDGKKMNIDRIEGRFAAFERLPYAITLRLSKPIAGDGYGTITVDGIEIPQGKQFFMDIVVKMHCLMVPVGSVVHEYGREYIMKVSGFTAEDGSRFPDTTLKFKTKERPQRDHSHDAHDDVALEAAREGMVLMKNARNVLPLNAKETLNCFGAAQYMFRNTATGAGLINPRWQADFHQALEEHSRFRVNTDISEIYLSLTDVCPSDELIQQAKRKSNTAVILLTRGSGEFLDNRPVKGGYYLTDDERAMIAKISGAFDKTVAILNTGYPIELSWIDEYGIDAVLYTGFAGMGAGYTLMEILDGRTNPSGKLPDSWAYDYYDYPAAHNFVNLSAGHKQIGEKECGIRIVYAEDIYIGYRYFDTFGKKTAFSFGHGLSYTGFEFSFGEPHYGNGILTVAETVTNSGRCSGKEVIQLYVEPPKGKLEKPRRVLCAFEKTPILAPGESSRLVLTAEDMTFSSYCEETGTYLLEKGIYHVWAGNSLENAVVIGSFVLSADKQLKKVNRVALPVEEFRRLTQSDGTIEECSGIVPKADRFRTPAPRPAYEPGALPVYRGRRITFPEVQENPELLDSFVAQMKDSELCRMNVCGGADWYMPWQSGAAGKTAAIRKYRLPKMTVSDGNTGLNLKKPNIGFPSSCTIAASFNKVLAWEVGRVIAEESVENGIGLNLGPAMNIHRNILNGRHPEYFSEDPYLSGIMAGYHGKGLEENGCGCTYKHLFCNQSETSRKLSHSIVSERALREIYFKAFEIAVGVCRPTAVMTSYNALNGIYPAENADILQTLLRDEWMLDSLIMTDWDSYDTIDPIEMVKAGNCWLTSGGRHYVRILQKGLKEGLFSRAVLENNVRWLMKALLRRSKARYPA